jgi:hypothetical protein
MPSSHSGSNASSRWLINHWQTPASNASKDPPAQAHYGSGITTTAHNTMLSSHGGSSASAGRLVNPWQAVAVSNADDRSAGRLSSTRALGSVKTSSSAGALGSAQSSSSTLALGSTRKLGCAGFVSARIVSSSTGIASVKAGQHRNPNDTEHKVVSSR